VTPDAIVIGGGVAGFSAATALAEAGARTLVLEARPGLGGRATAFTDPGTGERVDNGQHILMGCYRDTLALLERLAPRIACGGKPAWRCRWSTCAATNRC
jgi:zeta-carotene desaturase